MPKKYHRRLYTKPASTPPVTFASSSSSSLTGRPSPSSSAEEQQPQTVNDLLNHLRLSQNNFKETASSQSHSRDHNILELSNQRTLHPSLNELLGVVLPPPPRPPRQPRVGQGATRRAIAGPPPPASWLSSNSNHGAGNDINLVATSESISINNPHNIPANHDNFNITSLNTAMESNQQENMHKNIRRKPYGWTIYHLPDQEVIPDDSLMHQCMQSIARNWMFHIEYDQHYLYTLRPALKSLLLSYVVTLNPTPVVDARGLNVFCHGPKQAIQLIDGGKTEDVKESWDAELESDDNSRQSTDNYGAQNMTHLDLSYLIGHTLSLKDVSRTLTISTINGTIESRFSSLTHLSLAYPRFSLDSPESIDTFTFISHGNPKMWSKLISMLTWLPTLTHLSLAGWPSSANFHKTSYAQILDEIDSGFSRLSKKLICLKWLDISGLGYYKKPSYADAFEGLSDGERLVVEALTGPRSHLYPQSSWNGTERLTTSASYEDGVQQAVVHSNLVRWDKHWRSMETIVWKDICTAPLEMHSRMKCPKDTRTCYMCYREADFVDKGANIETERERLEMLRRQGEPKLTEIDRRWLARERQQMARNQLARQLQAVIRDMRVQAVANGVSGGGGPVNCRVITQ